MESNCSRPLLDELPLDAVVIRLDALIVRRGACRWGSFRDESKVRCRWGFGAIGEVWLIQVIAPIWSIEIRAITKSNVASQCASRATTAIESNKLRGTVFLISLVCRDLSANQDAAGT